MRGLVILLGLLLAAAAGALVALPRFVDEPALRTRLLALAERSTGYDLAIEGAVRLELVPWPRLSVDRVRVAEAGLGWLTADRLDVDLALLPLLAGRLEPSRARLVRPHLALERLPERPAAALLSALGRGAGEVEAVELVDGSLDLAPAPGSAWPRRLEALEATLAWDRDRRRFAFAGAGLVEGEEPLRLALDLEPVPGGGPFTARLDFATGGEQPALAGGFEGSVALEGTAGGRARLAASGAPAPAWLDRLLGPDPLPPLPAFELAGRLAAEPGAWAVQDLELGLAGNRLRGSLRFERVLGPRLHLALEGNRAELPPELEQALRRAAAAPLPPDLEGRVELRLASLAWRGGELRRLQAELDLAKGGRLGVPRLEATLPGAATLRWVGRESPPGTLAGAVSLHAGELRGFLGWAGVAPGDLPPGGLTSLDLAAEAEVTRDRLALRALDARLDATSLQGSVALARGARPLLELDLAADRVNAALYLPTRSRFDPEAWRDRLAAIDLEVALAIERLSHDRWSGGRASLRGSLTAGKLTLRELLVVEPGGNALRASGSAEATSPALDLAGELILQEPRPLARLFGRELPPAVADLAPIRLSGRLASDQDAGSVTATVEAAGVEASLAGTVGGPLDLRYLDLEGRFEAAEPAELLAALGWPTPFPDGSAASRFVLRRGGGAFGLTFDGRFGRSDLEGEVELRPGDPVSAEAELRSRALDTALLRPLYDGLSLALGLPPGLPWQWPGLWPRAPADWSWLTGLDLRLDVAADALRHGGASWPGAKANVALHRGRLTLTDLSLPLAGGTLAGTLSLEDEGDGAVLAADVRLAGARARPLAAAVALGSGLEGELDLGLRLAGSGRSVADLVGTLRGEGEVALREGRLGGIVFPPPADGAVAALAPGLAFDRLEGPLTVERGVVASADPGLRLVHPGGEATARFRLDLLAWIAELHLIDGYPPAAGTAPPTVRLIGAPGRLRGVPVPKPAADGTAP